MHNNLDLQLQFHQFSTMEKDQRSGFRASNSANEDAREWISAFNTSILTTRANELKERQHDLSALMQSPEFTSLLIGAQHLAESQGISKEEATERLIETFRKMDAAWSQLVLKRGIQTMIE